MFKGNARFKKIILYITELVLRKLNTILYNPVDDVAEAIPLQQLINSGSYLPHVFCLSSHHVIMLYLQFYLL